MATLSPPSLFTGDWVTEAHPDYKSSIARWATNAERRAKAVAFVKNAQDVTVVLKYAQEHGIALAVRGGGHSTGGASSIEGGIVIDLSRHLASVSVDVEKQTARVGGGALWETVDKTCIGYGLATVAGTVNHTGVGGLLIHGGFGFLTGEHGLALDQLVQATIVTADQQVRTISSTENPDLFWAVRGAGSNFGVITEFVLKLHPQRRTVFAGMAIYDPAKVEDLMSTMAERYTRGLSQKELYFSILTKGPDGNLAVVLILFWNGSEEDGRVHFKQFFDLGPVVDTCKEIPYEPLNALQNHGAAHGKNNYFKGYFTPEPSFSTARATLDYINKISIDGLTVAAVCECIPLDKVLSVPAGETSHLRRFRISNMLIGTWVEGGSERVAEVRRLLNEGLKIVLKNEKNASAPSNTGYGNYVSDEVVATSTGGELLFEENYPRLQALKKQYDPGMHHALYLHSDYGTFWAPNPE